MEISIEIRTKFNLIHEHEWTGNSISDICKKYEISRRHIITRINYQDMVLVLILMNYHRKDYREMEAHPKCNKHLLT